MCFSQENVSFLKYTVLFKKKTLEKKLYLGIIYIPENLLISSVQFNDVY